MKSFDETVELRSIQQYLYCPHRFGLMENNCCWAENVFVNKGNIAHKRICNGESSLLRGVIQERSVRVYNDKWGLVGILDLLELEEKDDGVYLPLYGKRYDFRIVECKVTAPKKGCIRYDERMQLLGQKICVDSVFGCDCKTYFYYSDTKKREEILFCKEDYSFLAKILDRIRAVKREGIIPPIKEDQYCSGCSMKDICLPPKRRSLR